MDQVPQGKEHQYVEFKRSTPLWMEEDGFGTLFREGDPENWFEEHMKSEEAQKVYNTNTDSRDGMLTVAKYYGIFDWTPDENKKIHQNQADLIRKIVDEGNGNKYIHLTPWEGKQRTMSMEHFSLCSPIDQFAGTLQPGELTIQDLADHLEGVPQHVLEKPPDIIAENEKLRTNGKEYMHNTVVAIKVSFVKNATAETFDATRLCEAFKNRSAHIANEKKESAQKEIIEIIDEKVMIEIYRDNVGLENLIYRPEFRGDNQYEQGKTKLAYQNYITVGALWEGVLPDDNKDAIERELFVQWAPVIDHPHFKEYMQNINDRDALVKAMALFNVKRVPDKAQLKDIQYENHYPVDVMPPFIPTLETQTHEALIEKDNGQSKGRLNKNKNCLWLNAKTANTHLIGPRTLLAFYAGTHNINVDQAQKSPMFKNLSNFYLRYCLHGNLQANSVDLHGAYNHVHQCGSETNTFTGNGRIIGATMFMTEMIHSCIARELESRKLSPNARLNCWKKTQKMISATILIMSHKKEGMQDEDIVETLGNLLYVIF